MEIEADRRRKMEETLRKQYYVVREETDAMRKGRVIGIDLGTTNSCIAYIDDKTLKPKIIPSPTGSWVFPTAVTFDKNHQVRMYGEEARACVRASASATLCSGKRLIGRRFGELGRVRSEMSKTNILSTNEKGDITIEIMGRSYTVVHIIAMFLRYLKNEAEKYLKETVNIAVVSVPAYFTPQQKVATEDAALCAGFDVLEIIDEPSAACLTHTVLGRLHEEPKGLNKLADKRILHSLVFDLGGGTLDCAIMAHDTYQNKFTLLATHGDPMLGGNDWDDVISQHFAKMFEKKWRVSIEVEGGNVGQEVSTYRNLLLEAEKAKVHFTHSEETYYGYNRAFHFSEQLRDILPLEATLTHTEYIALTRPLRGRCLECVNKLFAHTGFLPEDIDSILLVGAMTRDPPIRHLLMEYLGRPIAKEETCPADYAVAIGCSIRAGMLQGTFPELNANTRFVSGTVQALRQGGWIRRAWGRVKSWTSSVNPNVIGQRWRGRARGLTDEEIELYAKELVEFEAACSRRLLLERAEDEANTVMRRVTSDSDRRQGMQERRIVQLTEQLKFWQYMVHNFHDHEEDLQHTVDELRTALDDLDGLTGDSVDGITAAGTIDFSKIPNKTIRTSDLAKKDDHGTIHEDATLSSNTVVNRDADPRKVDISEVEVPPSSPSAASPAVDSQSSSPLQSQPPLPTPVRPTVPLPKLSTEAAELVKAGHPVLVNAPDNVRVTESTRVSFLENLVEERAWREPPRPPGEEGSWIDVKKALDAGEAVGVPVQLEKFSLSISLGEMLAKLKQIQPVDDPPSEEHVRARDLTISLQSITILKGEVNIEELENKLAEELHQASEVQKCQQKNEDLKADISASLAS
ncbi:unnamed protein product [Phytomonas sp. Hart1]|nr:unnamed protein product [Phytomonas sp. Hart1]|eukprot:CCW70177.1 unnamed protein product [Phytomonas sp. isolate Hart1]